MNRLKNMNVIKAIHIGGGFLLVQKFCFPQNPEEFIIELATQIFAFRKNGKILIAVPTITETSNKSKMSELKTRKDRSVDFFRTKLRLTKAQTQAIM